MHFTTLFQYFGPHFGLSLAPLSIKYKMDLNIQKLKSRLNLKFEPIHPPPRRSLKKIQAEVKQKKKNEDRSIVKLRSNSQVKLPSLSNRSNMARYQTLQDSKSYVNVAEFREKAKSYKQIPKVKIESKETIHNTVTYLMRNEILNVPRIVALLQKNESDEFIYLRNTGIYQYEACDERTKGFSYVTVSKNGMVQNGELITLQTLVREFELYKKLKKIEFFRHYHLIKYIGKWKQGSKVARFYQSRRNLARELNLSDPKIQQYRLEMLNMFTIEAEGGWLQNNWVRKLASQFMAMKQECVLRVIQICYRMLEHFELPISESTDLMNRVLGNLSSLSISFEKKIRIQKQAEKFYKLARQLELSAMQKVAEFILVHVSTLIAKTKSTTHFYETGILECLQILDISKQSYAQQKQKILLNTTPLSEIDYALYYNPAEGVLGIRPSAGDICRQLLAHVKEFMREVDRIGFRIVRTEEFRFIIRNVFKAGEDEPDDDDRNLFKKLVMGMPRYETLEDELNACFMLCHRLFQRRLALLTPFLQLYEMYAQERRQPVEFTNYQLYTQYMVIQHHLQFCDKISEAQPFIFGVLRMDEFKNELMTVIKDYETKLLERIPPELDSKRAAIMQTLEKHKEVFSTERDTPQSFIRINQEIEKLEQNALEYSAGIDELQKIQQFYEKCTKVKLNSSTTQKKLLSELRNKMRIFVQERDTSIAKYRRMVELEKQALAKRVNMFESGSDQFYNPSFHPQKAWDNVRTNLEHLLAAKGQLIQLNTLQMYYGIKPTFFASLQLRAREYESLEQIWRYSSSIDRDEADLSKVQIKDIDSDKYIKQYEGFLKRAQRYMKDSDLVAIATASHQKVKKFCDIIETLKFINTQFLRQKDIDEINYLIERNLNIKNHGSIKCRQLNYLKAKEYKLQQLKINISEITFKSKKQIQITQELSQFYEWWKNMKLDFETLNEYPAVPIFGPNLLLRDQIDEKMTVLLNILNSKYGTFVRAECNSLLKKMNNLVDMLQLLQIHQDKFLSLFPILTSKYAESQLSMQCLKFDAILNKTIKGVKVLARPTENLNKTSKNLLNNHIKQFDSISKFLVKFLENKRLKFQRFYFLQDYELLQVLVGIGNDKNVFRMFEGIKGWLSSPEGIKTGVIGIGDEKLVLRGWNYKSNIEPELIFKSLQQAIKSNLNSIVRNTLYQYEVQMKQLGELYANIPWMCIYAVELILYVKQVELNCFHNGVKLEAQEALIKEAINRAAVSPMLYSNYITLLLQLLHFTQQLRQRDICSIFDFEWNSFLRYYYEKDSVVMRSLHNEIKWGGEYQGLWSLMVYTSDIQRAHICVLNNLQYANGVLLQGPSGTGKTESLKQLARCTAKYCVVFNCSMNVNVKTMAKLLSGLCYTASWLCLDEINRLSLESMSAIAKQIQSIKNAILAKKQSFNFMGKDIRLKQGVAIFATMNPIYLKRAKLTENIKSYFRTITVSMPEHDKILQVLLYGLKFFRPRELALKIGNTLSNLSIQLSKNPQYDFGLRAMKFMVWYISRRRQQSENEFQIVGRAFYDVFASKIVASDRIIFDKVIADNFKYRHPTTTLAMEDQVQAMKESPQTGLIVVGPASAKSMLIKQYCESYDSPYVQYFNPSSTDLKYFLGESLHGKWESGVVEHITRLSLNNPSRVHILILDSTLKSEIIENFNTLLDESRLLTLSNGTRLKVQDNLKVIMQTPHLTLTSPSTITRCHISYVCDADVDTGSLIDAQIPVYIQRQKGAQRLREIYSRFSNKEIREIGRLAKIILTPQGEKFSVDLENVDVLGVERATIFAIRLLGIGERVVELMNKQNAFPVKKSPFHFVLSFEKYSQGQFSEISRTYEAVPSYTIVMIKTSQQIFMKWLTNKSIAKPKQSLLWKGAVYSGKTRGLTYSLKQKHYIKVSLNKYYEASQLASLLLPQMLDKKAYEEKNAQMIIYLENLHLSTEQVSEQVRFIMEHNKVFSSQAREILAIQSMPFVSESRLFETKQFDRVRRHFCEIALPQADQIELKNIYSVAIEHYLSKSELPSAIKGTINVEIERTCQFLAAVFSHKNATGMTKLGSYWGCSVIQKFNSISYDTWKEVNDFVAAVFEALSTRALFSPNPGAQANLIIQTYLELYKGKFSKEYQKYFKNLANGREECLLEDDKLTQIKERLQSFESRYYISEHIQMEIAQAYNILGTGTAHYCLRGSLGSGRRTIFLLLCQANNISYVELPNEISEKDIKRIYFQKLRRAFDSRTIEAFLVDFDSPQHHRFLQFAESVAIGTSATMLFDSEDTDYMYARRIDEIGGDIKTNKSYEEICQQFVASAHQFMRLLMISCESNRNLALLNDFPTIEKHTYHRVLPQYPIQALISCTDRIISKKLKIDPNSKENIYVLNFPRFFMKVYKVCHELSTKNKRNKLNHFNFTELHLFRLVELFCKQHERTVQRVKEREELLNRVIAKVQETSKLLESIKEQLIQMEPEVKLKRERVLEVVPILDERKKKIQFIKYSIQSEKKEIDIKQEQISGIMKEVEDQIAQSTPLLNEAIQSIQTIKRNDLSNIKNNTNPHPLIKFTMENLVIILGEQQSWENIRRALSDVNLMTRIKNCHCSDDAYYKVKKRISEFPDWTFESVSKISYDTRFLYKWIRSIIKYKDIEIEIDKKKHYIEKLKASLRQSELKEQQKMAELAEREKDSQQIESEYAKIKKQLNGLEEIIDNNKRRLGNAEKIKTNLEQNLLVWVEKLEQTREVKNYIISYNILLCLELFLYPALTSEEENQVRRSIVNIFIEEKFPLPKKHSILQDVAKDSKEKTLFNKISSKNLEGPKNILLAHYFYKQPLVIDPDGQAMMWLENLQLQQKLTCVKKSFAGAQKTVQDAMRNGQILIILLDSEISPFEEEIMKSMDGSLSKSQSFIQYNKSMFALHPEFCLIFYTQSSKPNISLKDSLSCPIINFEITKSSLQSVLVAAVMRNEKPDLYDVKTRVQATLSATTQQLDRMEQQIIKSLLGNKRQLIDDDAFVSLLTQNRAKADYYAQRKKAQEKQVLEVQDFTSRFSNLCGQAASMFITLKQMAKINPNLVWNVDIFIRKFVEGCQHSISNLIEDQLMQLNQSFVGNFEFEQVPEQTVINSRPTSAFSRVSIAISRNFSDQNIDEADKIILDSSRGDQNDESHQKTQQAIQPVVNDIQASEKQQNRLFASRDKVLNENLKGVIDNQRYQNIIKYITNYFKQALNADQRTAWAFLYVLKDANREDVKSLMALLRTSQNKKRSVQLLADQNMLTQNLKKYFAKFEGEQAEYLAQKALTFNQQLQDFEERAKHNLTELQILMIAQALHPNNFMKFVRRLMLKQNTLNILQYAQNKVSQWIDLSDNIHPCLLLMGEDPIYMISQFLERKKYKNATLVAIGEEQGRGLDLLIDKQSRKQGVFIVHNLHIAPSFMSLLGRIVQQFNYKPPHKNFRLILIGNIEASYPEQLSSMCHKFIVQQPSGLKNKMKDLYKKTEPYIDHSVPSQHKLAYSLCLMHSLVNQMHKYGSLCWNFPPLFTTDDFLGAVMVIRSVCDQGAAMSAYKSNIESEDVDRQVLRQGVDFQKLRYLIGEVCYVGKLSDEIDRRKMRLIVDNHFNKGILEGDYIFWQGSGISHFHQSVLSLIELIDQYNPATYGLDPESIIDNVDSGAKIANVVDIYLPVSSTYNGSASVTKFTAIKPISHRLEYINTQISSYNAEAVGRPQGTYLSRLEENSRAFDLRAFNNPQKLFVSVKIELAIKNNVPYDSIALVWALAAKENYYGISNLTLQGGSIKNGFLAPGAHEKQVTLYFAPVVRKKDKDPNKGKVAIPLYVSHKRGDNIGTYGQNTSLIIQVLLDSKQPAESWVLRGTAFIVS